MLLVYKYHSILILTAHAEEESYSFRAYVPERLMAEYARWARQQGLMIRDWMHS